MKLHFKHCTIKLFFIAMAIHGLIGSALYAQAQKKPNIILIMADDLGYETLGCNGNDTKLTPHLDSLAATGMLFENCHAQPLCTPSRVQLMTGKYNNANYIGFGLLDPREKTFGQLMQQQGYKTCIAGKWQLYGDEKQVKLAGGLHGTKPEDAGFDNFCVWQVDQLGSRYRNPTVYTDDRKSVKLDGQYGDDVFEKYIESFLEKNSKKPFFVYYPMCLTHDPFVPTPFSADYAKGIDNDSPQYFNDMLRYMDYLNGRIFKKVKELGLADNTIIIYTGDNGTSTKIVTKFRGGERRGNKGYPNDRGTHVPLIVNWKGQIKPSVNKSLIDFTDFFPTLLQIAGNKTAAKTLGLDGMSFYPQLKGDLSKKRDWVFSYYDPKWGTFKKSVFAYNEKLKLYSTGEIYRLDSDPEELKPLTKDQLNTAELKVIKNFEQVIASKPYSVKKR